VIASKQSPTVFSDKEQVWVDNAESSPFFGNAYVCVATFKSLSRGNAAPTPLVVARSTDGGDTWTNKQVTDATDPFNPLQGKSNPLIDKWLSKKKKVAQPDDTPEPDPTDKPSEGDAVAQTKPAPLTPHVSQELPSPTAEDPFHPAAPESYKNPSALY